MFFFHGYLKETVKPKSEVLISLSVWTLFCCLFRFEFPKLAIFALVLPFLSQETIKVQIKYILKS